MKFATTLVLLLGLFGSPVACLIEPCHFEADSHDCCSRSHSQRPVLAACPLDLLASAKAAPRLHSAPAFLSICAISPAEPSEPAFAPASSRPIPDDGRDLHLRNRVLRL